MSLETRYRDIELMESDQRRATKMISICAGNYLKFLKLLKYAGEDCANFLLRQTVFAVDIV